MYAAGVEVRPLLLKPLSGPMYQLWKRDEDCASSRWNERVAENTEVLGENLPQRRFFHPKSHMIWPGLELRPPRWEPGN
jgi:hypothetical protein